MSFSSQVKNELAHRASRKNCCQVAELSAIIRMDGSLAKSSSSRGYALRLSMENAAVARRVIKLFAGIFALHAVVTVRRSRLNKRNNYLVEIKEDPKLSQTLNELGILDDSLTVRYDITPRLTRKSCCAAAYLRGLFMGGGFVSNPDGGYHFEIVTDNNKLANDAKALMERFNLSPKILSRKHNLRIYLKGADQIIQLLALIGAHNALLKWEDKRIIKGMRASVNRLVNCDTANLNKAVEAALSQLRDIALIEEKMGIDKLPQGLAELANTRLAYPQASIRELGEVCQPPLSKSAVYHRLRRLRLVADNLSRQN